MADELEVLNVLSTFRCEKDVDIELFLMNLAVPFEKAHKARTYFILNDNYLETGRVEILGFFSLAIDNLIVGGSVSMTEKRKVNGIFQNDMVPCYLLGQLARNDRHPNGIKGNDILNYVFNILLEAKELVGGRFVRVDCKDVNGLLRFYSENGFSKLPDKRDEYIQFIRFF